jgi:hypothetical protein
MAQLTMVIGTTCGGGGPAPNCTAKFKDPSEPGPIIIIIGSFKLRLIGTCPVCAFFVNATDLMQACITSRLLVLVRISSRTIRGLL